MAVAFVQYNDATEAGGDSTIANAALATTTGNLLVVCTGGFSNTTSNAEVSSIADTAGNTYVRAIGAWRSGTTGERAEIWYAKNITGHATNVTTITYVGNCSDQYISVSEYSGADTTAPLDDTSSQAQSATTAHSSGNAAASTNDAVLVGVLNAASQVSWTAESNAISSDLTSVYSVAEYEILTASGDYDSDYTSSVNTATIFVAAIFKGAAAGDVASGARVQIGDAWKEVSAAYINIADAWKEVSAAYINIADAWKEIII